MIPTAGPRERKMRSGFPERSCSNKELDDICVSGLTVRRSSGHDKAIVQAF
jgi:hypothetical protein